MIFANDKHAHGIMTFALYSVAQHRGRPPKMVERKRDDGVTVKFNRLINTEDK